MSGMEDSSEMEDRSADPPDPSSPVGSRGGNSDEELTADSAPGKRTSRARVAGLAHRHDHFFQVESSQVPLFRLLGMPEKDRKHIFHETGRAPPRKEVIKESLDWLDRYLGPVKRWGGARGAKARPAGRRAPFERR
jgi:hypothetical protein